MPTDQTDYSPIFEPIKIGNVEIKNRIAMAPMNMNYTDPGGRPSRQQLAYYAARAKGGTGLIVVEAVLATKAPWASTYEKYDNLSIARGKEIRSMANLAEHIHAFGAKVFVQLAVSPGRQGSAEGSGIQPHAPSAVAWEVQPHKLPRGFEPQAIFRALGYQGEIPTTPEGILELAKKIPGAHLGGELPREITVDEIQELVRDIGQSALHSRIAGYDGVEIHAPHGYLMHSFFSERSNRRSDQYGGSFENRIRMLMECIRSIRAKVGPDYTVGVRISASEDLPGGFDPHFTARIAKRCEEEGASFIHLSDGSYEAMNDFLPDKDGQVVEKAAIIKQGLGIPLICPSVHSPKSVAKALREGKADMISQGRQQIADPDWVNKVSEGRTGDIVRCTRCNLGCIGRFMLGLPGKCDLNPMVGQEEFMDEYMKRTYAPVKTRVWQTMQEIGVEPSVPMPGEL